MYLSGYGVELAIKSTEYKVVDDSQAKGTFLSCMVLLETLLSQNIRQFLTFRKRESSAWPL